MRIGKTKPIVFSGRYEGPRPFCRGAKFGEMYTRFKIGKLKIVDNRSDNERDNPRGVTHEYDNFVNCMVVGMLVKLF